MRKNMIRARLEDMPQGKSMPFKTVLAKLIQLLMLWKNHCGLGLIFLLVLGLPCLCFAQELEPRRWSHLPTGANFFGGGYAYTEADIFFDPVLRLENVEMEMNTWALQYIHSFEMFQKSARIDIGNRSRFQRLRGSMLRF